MIGPLSKDIDGIELFMKVVTTSRPWLLEPALLPLPWTPYRVNPMGRPLKIAIMWHDDVVLPHPPITRALKTMESKLRDVPNMSVSRWKPYLHDKAWDIISCLYYPDGGDADTDLLNQAGEPILPLTKWIKENPCVKTLSFGELYYWKAEREAYRKQYAKIWNDTADEASGEVDAILCPVGPGLAPKHETAKYWGYTSQWNLLDYPAIVFPVCKAHADIDRKERATKPMTDVDKDNWDLCKPALYDLIR